jgi:hypothetical protein
MRVRDEEDEVFSVAQAASTTNMDAVTTLMFAFMSNLRTKLRDVAMKTRRGFAIHGMGGPTTIGRFTPSPINACQPLQVRSSSW